MFKFKEWFYINFGFLISMDGGLVVSWVCGGGWFWVLVWFLLGKENLMVNVIYNFSD